VYDLFFQDDLGRCRLYVNKTTGAYQWDILSGIGAGQSFLGTVIGQNGWAKIVTPPGAPHTVNVTFDPLRKRAYGYMMSSTRIYSYLSDSNTADSLSASCL
jgi:hypothetical protein